MNHKPDSVMDSHLSGTAVAGRLRAVYPRLTNGPLAWIAGQLMAQPFTTLLDFAPDEVYRSGRVAAAEVGSYPAVSPFPFAGKPDKRRFTFCCTVCSGAI